MNCSNCSQPIEQERQRILPKTRVCSHCAHKLNLIKPNKGVMIYGHKTGGEIQIMSANSYEEQKAYYIPNGARSCVKNFLRSVCS